MISRQTSLVMNMEWLERLIKVEVDCQSSRKITTVTMGNHPEIVLHMKNLSPTHVVFWSLQPFFSCVAKLLKRRCQGIQRFAHSPGILRYKNKFVSFATPIPSEHQQWLLLWEAWSRAFVHSWLWRGQWFDISSNTTWVWFRLLKRGCYLGCRPPSDHQDYIFRWPGIPNKTGCNPPKSLGDFPSWRTVNLTSQNSWTNVPLMEEISVSSGRYKKHSI